MTRLIVLLLAAALLCLAGCHSAGQPSTSASQPEGTGASQSSAPSQPSADPSEPEPDFEWAVESPEAHGMDAALLVQMHAALADTGIYSALTVRDGVIVDEYYREGYDQQSVFRFNSCSKSFTSALVGIALEEGLIEVLDVSIATFFPELAGTEKEAITVRHLLTHTSGLEFHEWTRDGESFYELNQAEDWVRYVLDKPLVAQPGTTFNYTTGGSYLLTAILDRVTEQPLIDYATERLFGPMGMDSVHWRTDPQGVPDGGNGIEMTSRDAAKFGLLYLEGGEWGGQQLVPHDWVELSTDVHILRYEGASGSYGFQWWIHPFGEKNYAAFYAMGAMGQFILVVPELELVTVFTSDDTQYAPWPFFEDYILAACG